MKSLLLLLLLLPSQAPEWRYIAKTKESRYYQSTRPPSADSAERGQVWEKEQPTAASRRAELVAHLAEVIGERDAERVAYLTHLREYDCAKRRARELQTLYHDEAGEVLRDERRKAGERDGWLSPPPKSIAERMMLAACEAEQEPREVY